jgi:hypothetical protein
VIYFCQCELERTPPLDLDAWEHCDCRDELIDEGRVVCFFDEAVDGGGALGDVF